MYCRNSGVSKQKLVAEGSRAHVFDYDRYHMIRLLKTNPHFLVQKPSLKAEFVVAVEASGTLV